MEKSKVLSGGIGWEVDEEREAMMKRCGYRKYRGHKAHEQGGQLTTARIMSVVVLV